MTTVFIALAGFAVIFVIGFLLGDRRGVKQCNAILDENWRELLEAIREDRSGFPSDADGEERVSESPTMH